MRKFREPWSEPVRFLRNWAESITCCLTRRVRSLRMVLSIHAWCGVSHGLIGTVMVFKRLHLGNSSFSADTVDELQAALERSFSSSKKSSSTGVFCIPPPCPFRLVLLSLNPAAKKGGRKTVEQAVRATIEALAICHNVTPTREDGSDQLSYQVPSPHSLTF